jgi:hypothetical protein
VPAKRRILVADLDRLRRSVVAECLPADRFDILSFDEDDRRIAARRVDLGF